MAKNNLTDPAAEERAKRADMNAGLSQYERETSDTRGVLEKEAEKGMAIHEASAINMARLKAGIPLSRASMEERAAYVLLYGRAKYDADLAADTDPLTAGARHRNGTL